MKALSWFRLARQAPTIVISSPWAFIVRDTFAFCELNSFRYGFNRLNETRSNPMSVIKSPSFVRSVVGVVKALTTLAESFFSTLPLNRMWRAHRGSDDAWHDAEVTFEAFILIPRDIRRIANLTPPTTHHSLHTASFSKSPSRRRKTKDDKEEEEKFKSIFRARLARSLQLRL